VHSALRDRKGGSKQRVSDVCGSSVALRPPAHDVVDSLSSSSANVPCRTLGALIAFCDGPVRTLSCVVRTPSRSPPTKTARALGAATKTELERRLWVHSAVVEKRHRPCSMRELSVQIVRNVYSRVVLYTCVPCWTRLPCCTPMFSASRHLPVGNSCRLSVSEHDRRKLMRLRCSPKVGEHREINVNAFHRTEHHADAIV
jgi:hypothetical protein